LAVSNARPVVTVIHAQLVRMTLMRPVWMGETPATSSGDLPLLSLQVLGTAAPAHLPENRNASVDGTSLGGLPGEASLRRRGRNKGHCRSMRQRRFASGGSDLSPPLQRSSCTIAWGVMAERFSIAIAARLARVKIASTKKSKISREKIMKQ
jgi:hypothetical protein